MSAPVADAPAAAAELGWPDDRATGAMRAGLVVIGVFFGVIGTWAAFAPLDSAAIAPAVIKVEGNRRSVQHLEGGILKELRVREGDTVKEGAVLLVLDNSQAQATYDVLRKQYLELQAQEARLKAERSNAGEIEFPKPLLDLRSDPDVQAVMRGEAALFTSRRTTLQGQIDLTRKKISQTREQITGLRAQNLGQTKQLDSTREELQGLQSLFKQGYVPRQRMMELDRSASNLEGMAADSASQIVKLGQQIEELTLQITQIQTDRQQQVDNDMRDVHARLLETMPKLQAARDIFERAEVRAPYSGKVVGLSVFGVGAVINRGDKILDIVPDSELLVVEAQLAVDDIKDVRPGMRAEVRLTAYKQRTVPIVFGEIKTVSADRLTDAKSGAPYYLVQIKLDEAELARLGDIKLVPGMAAEVAIPTSARTALDYLLRPLTDSLNRSFRQR
jgi:HlyD family type I secretion membrane fusion protein